MPRLRRHRLQPQKLRRHPRPARILERRRRARARQREPRAVASRLTPVHCNRWANLNRPTGNQSLNNRRRRLKPLPPSTSQPVALVSLAVRFDLLDRISVVTDLVFAGKWLPSRAILKDHELANGSNSSCGAKAGTSPSESVRGVQCQWVQC